MIEVHDRPLITFALFAYNQEKFIREAVEGAFAQTYSPLEIILSDDCSSDGTFNVIQALTAAYRGPHKVLLNRNTHNLGLAAHINRVMELSSGELIVAAAGDDVSYPQRTSAIYDSWKADRRATYFYSKYEPISDAAVQENLSRTRQTSKPGKECENLLLMIANCGPDIQGSTEAWHRSIFDVFGSLPDELLQEDRALPFRAILLGKLAYVDETLVKYRKHPRSIWGGLRCGYSQTFDENSRRRLIKLKQRLAIFNSFRSDLLLAMKKSLIAEDLARHALATIEAGAKETRLQLAARSGSPVRRLSATLQLLLSRNNSTTSSFRASVAALLFAVFPALEKQHFERARRRLAQQAQAGGSTSRL